MTWVTKSLSFQIGSDWEDKPDAVWKVHCGFDSEGNSRFSRIPLGPHDPGPVEYPEPVTDDRTGARTYPEVPDDPRVSYDVDLWWPAVVPEGENLGTVLTRLLA